MNRSLVRSYAFLVTALMISLAIFGVGYAQWSGVLTAEGLVSMASLDFYWTNSNSLDPAGAKDPVDDWGMTRGDYDIGELICTVDGPNPSILHFIVQSGYPEYYGICDANWKNASSYPLTISGLQVGPAGGPYMTVAFGDYTALDLDGDLTADIELVVVRYGSDVISPGGTSGHRIVVHVLDGAPADQDLDFVAYVILH